MKTKYLNYLSYNNAKLVQDYIDTLSNGSDTNAYFSCGCLVITLNDNDWIQAENYIKSLGVKYSLTDEHLYH
jgi:hypothetical protein